MIAVGRPGVEKAYGWKDWSVCSNGEACFVVSDPSLAMVGTNAGSFGGGYGGFPSGPGGSACWVFLFENSTGWHYVNAACVQNSGSNPATGDDQVFVTGCANFRATPALSAAVLGCLGNGTNVDVDSAPVYQGGHIWWHLAGRGWMAHDFLCAACLH
jgi:hypothetical protein